MWGINVEVVTIEDCLDLYKMKDIGVEINDGVIVGFTPNKVALCNRREVS